MNPLLADMANQQYCLRWNNHQNNLLKVFARLLGSERFTDVVLAAEGCTIRAHKVVLSACSTYFERLFSEFSEPNQIVILKDTTFADATAIVEFMYRGEINVSQAQLTSLLRSAENLRVKGLAEVSSNGNEGEGKEFSAVPAAPPPSAHRPYKRSAQDHRHPSGEVKRKRGRPRTLDSPNEPPDPCFVSSSSNPGRPHSSVRSHDPVENGGGGPVHYVPTPGGPLTTERLGELGIVKMNDYLASGTRQQFWEEYFVKVILQAVCNKEIDMKTSAELLGVSYGTLYGRYRDTFGYLKGGWNGQAPPLLPPPPPIPPNRPSARGSPTVEMDNADADDVDEDAVLRQLRDGRIDMRRAGEMLGMDETMLTYQMALKFPDDEDKSDEGSGNENGAGDTRGDVVRANAEVVTEDVEYSNELQDAAKG